MKKRLIAGITGLMGLVLLASSFRKDTFNFKFNNPVPIHATPSEIERIVNARPEITDKEYSLKFPGVKIPLVTYRTVTEPTTGESYSGRLDSNGDIHSEGGLHVLQFAHDSNWYEPLKKQ